MALNSETETGDRRRVRSPQLWPAAAVLAVLAVLGQAYGLYRPSGPPQLPFGYADKVEHALGFALPVLLILLALSARTGPVSRRPVGVVAAIFAAHAVVSELIQHRFYRYRTGDPWDVVADWVGVALGVAVFWRLRGRAPVVAKRRT